MIALVIIAGGANVGTNLTPTFNKLRATCIDVEPSEDALMAAGALKEIKRAERRRHQRANVILRGRYMLTDRHEYDCQTIDISSGGVAVLGPIKGAIGERVVAYFDQIGRVEGMIVRHFGTCFAVELRASMLKRDKLDLEIEILVKHRTKGAGNRRRIAPSA
jgi:hypothetical protein